MGILFEGVRTIHDFYLGIFFVTQKLREKKDTWIFYSIFQLLQSYILTKEERKKDINKWFLIFFS